MSKPNDSRPFDLLQAQAGAPIATVNRGAAHFVTYLEVADPSCCVVILDCHNIIGTRRKSGRTNEAGAADNPHDLVMLPLGHIDGLPVWWDSKLEQDDGTEITGEIYRLCDVTAGIRWPAPTKVYPETLMINSDIDELCKRGTHWIDNARIIANAALKHAINAGQLIIPSEAKPGVRPHNPYTGHLRHPVDIANDPMGVALYCEGETLICFKGDEAARAARDMTVAIAVRDECQLLAGNSTGLGSFINANCNLTEIIARVTK